VVLLSGLGCGGGARTETAPKPAETSVTPAPPEPAKADDSQTYDPATAAGAVRGVPAPTNSGNIEAVANFFADMPGFDLNALGKHGREKFLHRVNSEMCTCGCKNDTLAFCYINDPKCPVVKGMVQAVYDEVKSGS
jgi:hypothetical protein